MGKTYYVIRRGWNGANQSSLYSKRTPKDTFESRLDMLVDIVKADTREAAVAKCEVSVYNNQFLYAVTHPRALKGLTREVRKYHCEE